MAIISENRIQEFITISDNADTTVEKGRALENLICYLFQKIPGIVVTRRNQLNTFESEEIDIAFWNNQNVRGLYFLNHIILVECKNWSNPTGSSEVSWFDSKLRHRGQNFGILVASNGITGQATEKTAAHDVISRSLGEGRQIIVITRTEIESLANTDQLVRLIQEKLCELAVSGTIFL